MQHCKHRFAHHDEPRLEFKGVLEVNPETGRQMMVPKSSFAQFVKKLLSFLVVLAMIGLTISADTLAMLLRYLADEDAV